VDDLLRLCGNLDDMLPSQAKHDDIPWSANVSCVAKMREVVGQMEPFDLVEKRTRRAEGRIVEILDDVDRAAHAVEAELSLDPDFRQEIREAGPLLDRLRVALQARRLDLVPVMEPSLRHALRAVATRLETEYKAELAEQDEDAAPSRPRRGKRAKAKSAKPGRKREWTNARAETHAAFEIIVMGENNKPGGEHLTRDELKARHNSRINAEEHKRFLDACWNGKRNEKRRAELTKLVESDPEKWHRVFVSG